jgi:hypothetical protein
LRIADFAAVPPGCAVKLRFTDSGFKISEAAVPPGFAEKLRFSESGF